MPKTTQKLENVHSTPKKTPSRTNKEIWLPANEKLEITGIMVSSEGVLKNRQGKIIHVNPKFNGLKKVRIKTNNGNYKDFPVTKIIMCTFHPEGQMRYVIFIDNDVTNYRADNLKWSNSITVPGKTRKGDDIKRNTRKIIEYDSNHNKIKTWRCAKDAGEEKGVSDTAIRNYCKAYPQIFNGSSFKYKHKQKSKKVEDLPGEKWKRFKAKNGDKLYVSNLQRVRNNKKELLKQNLNNAGYPSVRTRHVNYRVDQLMAKTWIDNEEDKPTVNHIDRDKTNNEIDNLEWATRREQELHKNKTSKVSRKVAIVELDKTGKIIKEYESTKLAAEDCDCDSASITSVCSGKRKSCYGRFYRYKHDMYNKK